MALRRARRGRGEVMLCGRGAPRMFIRSLGRGDTREQTINSGLQAPNVCGLTHFGVPPKISFSARKTLSKMSTIRSTTSSRFARVDCFGSRSKLYVLSWSKLRLRLGEQAGLRLSAACVLYASFASFRFFVVDVQREVGEPDGIREIRENHGDEREARFRAQEQPRRHRRIEHRQKRREEQLERAGGVRAGRRGGERVDSRAGRGGGDGDSEAGRDGRCPSAAW